MYLLQVGRQYCFEYTCTMAVAQWLADSLIAVAQWLADSLIAVAQWLADSLIAVQASLPRGNILYI